MSCNWPATEWELERRAKCIEKLGSGIAELEAQTQWSSVAGVDPATLRYPVVVTGNGPYVCSDASEFYSESKHGSTHFLELPSFNPKTDL